ncbi:hypothetical protein EB061_01080 [bacterium]|nr:hypothetical protein [bacterium]
MDWQGRFQVETNTLFGYSHDQVIGKGYNIPHRSDSPANFQNLFLSLKPRVLVNDNVSLFSDLWFNSPDAGFFGSNTTAGGTYSINRTGNGTVSARAFYAEVATDFGTFRVGRMPLQFGLGLIWNSSAPGNKSRLPSYGDGMSLTTKLGAFKVTPAFVKYQQARLTTASPAVALADSGITDYALNLSYQNEDEQMDAGLQFMRRLAGPSAGVVDPFATNVATTVGYAYNVWDLYAKKKSGMMTYAAEIPLATGLVSSQSYSTVAGAINARADLNDFWNLKLNMGAASGQGGNSPNKLTAFYFHPDYRPGLILFNYNLRNLSNGTGSAYDNPITNARFFSLSAGYARGKFSHEWLALYAFADQAATGGTNPFFNTWNGQYEQGIAGAGQGKALGFEFDYSLGYDWDESTRFGADLGLFFPGSYYAFSNSAVQNTQKTVFATNLGMTVKF